MNLLTMCLKDMQSEISEPIWNLVTYQAFKLVVIMVIK